MDIEKLKKAFETENTELLKSAGCTWPIFSLDYAMEIALLCESLELVEILVNKGYRQWNKGLFDACYHGNIELAKYFINKGARLLDIAMYISRERLNKDVALFLIECGVNIEECYKTFNGTGNYCLDNTPEIVLDNDIDYLIKKGITKFYKYDQAAQNCRKANIMMADIMSKLLIQDLTNIIIQY